MIHNEAPMPSNPFEFTFHFFKAISPEKSELMGGVERVKGGRWERKNK